MVGERPEVFATLEDAMAYRRRVSPIVAGRSEADQREWDDFESTFRAGRQEWLLANPGHPRAADIREWLDDRERGYVTVYRGILGFAHVVLAR